MSNVSGPASGPTPKVKFMVADACEAMGEAWNSLIEFSQYIISAMDRW